MDPKFVSLLIQQLLNTTHCPKCGASILPTNVKIENISENTCLFRMQCAKCKTVISADAQMANTPLTKTNPTEPASIPLQKGVFSQEKNKIKSVSLEDLMAIKKILSDFPGTFKNITN